MIKRFILAVTVCILLTNTAQALSDAKYMQMLNDSPEFAQVKTPTSTGNANIITEYREQLNELMAFSDEMQSLTILVYLTGVPRYLAERFEQDSETFAKALADYSKLVDAYEANPSKDNEARLNKSLTNLKGIAAKFMGTMLELNRWL